MNRARSVAWWIAPSLLCLALHWRGFTAWFRADDFAWLGVGLNQNLLHALFSPDAQGTIRPLSERAFFMAGFALFGLNPLPFRIVVFATQFANLALVAWIGSRLSGLRAAGFWAAVFWAINSSLVEPLGWTCVYNQVLCGFFLLLAFYCLLRYVETGRRVYNLCQWIAFLIGFGALELNVVYPALAAAFTFLCARRYFRRVLPLFAASLLYFVLHTAVAPAPQTGDYVLHFTGSMLRTLGAYWTWSVGPVLLRTPFSLPNWLLPVSIAAVSGGLLWFLARKLRAGLAPPGGAALFCLVWYFALIAPLLPLRDHPTGYYLYLPLIGICWLGGWAFAAAWRAGAPARVAAAALVLLYAFMAVPRELMFAEWNHHLSLRVRNLVEGAAGAHQLHPRQDILLEGVDTELFWNGIADRPFHLLGMHVYLAPGSERTIEAHLNWGDIDEFVLPPDVTARALNLHQLVVYDVRGPRLRNITANYVAPAEAEPGLPLRIDVANALSAYLLGPEWYPVEGNHRWMPKRATLRMHAPSRTGQSLYIHGYCPEGRLRDGPLSVTVAVDGSTHDAVLHPGENDFDLAFPLPGPVAGRTEMRVSVEVSRTYRTPSDQRDLGLVFGVFEVR